MGKPNPQNLIPAKKGECRNPNGRPKKMVNAIKGLPVDLREKVYSVLAFALTLKDENEAKAYLKSQEGELGQCGFVLQICIKQLLKEGWGFGAMMDIMDRLYGKPRETREETHKVEGLTIVVNTPEEADRLKGMGKLDI